MREVERKEDMSCNGKLRLLQQTDGDIIVVVHPEQNGLVGAGSAVEFCTRSGGGRSPKTLHALRHLMDAMEEDNL